MFNKNPKITKKPYTPSPSRPENIKTFAKSKVKSSKITNRDYDGDFDKKSYEKPSKKSFGNNNKSEYKTEHKSEYKSEYKPSSKFEPKTASRFATKKSSKSYSKTAKPSFDQKNPTKSYESRNYNQKSESSFGGRSENKFAKSFDSKSKNPPIREQWGTKKSYDSNYSKPIEENTNTNLSTSWGSVASWYQKMINDSNSYQNKVILPEVLSSLDIKPHQKILDLGCGVGFFCQKYFEKGAEVKGVDIGSELIDIAKKETDPKISYKVSKAENIDFLKDKEFDSSTIVLALQNMQEGSKVIEELTRVTKKKIVIILNHPYYRQPKYSSWIWDSREESQYRRVDRYLTPYSSVIDMNPSSSRTYNSRENTKATSSTSTTSFHRPFSWYVNEFSKNGFVVTRMRELTSHIPADQGPLKTPKLELSRKEIPLFMSLILERKG